LLSVPQAFEDRHFTEREGFFRHEVSGSTLGLMIKNAGLIRRSSQALELLRALRVIQKNLESVVAIGWGKKRVRPERLKKPASK
jgi:hypothetical protein